MHKSDFSDAVVLLHEFDPSSGAAVLELCEPLNAEGRAVPTGVQQSAKFTDRGKEALQETLAGGHQGALFLGSVMTQNRVWRVGHWCDVLPWAPMPDGIEHHK